MSAEQADGWIAKTAIAQSAMVLQSSVQRWQIMAFMPHFGHPDATYERLLPRKRWRRYLCSYLYNGTAAHHREMGMVGAGNDHPRIAQRCYLARPSP